MVRPGEARQGFAGLEHAIDAPVEPAIPKFGAVIARHGKSSRAAC
jgi:hypothetical protein